VPLYFSARQLEISGTQLIEMPGQLLIYFQELLKTAGGLLFSIQELLIPARKLGEHFYQFLFSAGELIIYAGEQVNVFCELLQHIPGLVNGNLQLGDGNYKCVKEYYKQLNGG
jgi:hypothetical protein